MDQVPDEAAVSRNVETVVRELTQRVDDAMLIHDFNTQKALLHMFRSG
ncbi:MAG: hypothetical protein OXR66_02255 [Candidatus Woesearchaeota archaeon]|nr:hypothetical protein [Candidatus Woesearchaeota archaeon]